MITTSLQLGPLTFDDFAETGWAFKDLVDWLGLTDDKSGDSERPQAIGAFESAQSLRSRRAISFKATFICRTQAEGENAIDLLSSVGATGRVPMVLTTPAGRTGRMVKVAKVTPLSHRGSTVQRVMASAAVDVIAADPRRYALDADVQWQETDPPSAGQGLVWPTVWPLIWPGGGSTGRITLTNTGKAPSAPVFRLLGGFTSALITCVETGARIGLDRPVPSGSVVEINADTHVGTIDGQSDVGRWLRWREWEMIPPESSRSYQFDATGQSDSPKMRGRVLSAWW